MAPRPYVTVPCIPLAQWAGRIPGSPGCQIGKGCSAGCNFLPCAAFRKSAGLVQTVKAIKKAAMAKHAADDHDE